MFIREFSEELIVQLKNHPLFKDELLLDIKKGNIFPAVRKKRIDFYYGGGKLFTFDKKGFKTHIKYASVYKSQDDYIYESEMEKMERIKSFKDGYKRIKENCSLYPGVEANGVSYIYSNYSYVASKSNIVVLDIEVSFKSDDSDKTQDRIDILLLNKDKNKLIFCEAKHYSNKEIWSRGTPKVVEQIQRYKDQIKDKGGMIIDQYSKYTKTVNMLFSLELPEPTSISERVLLIVFGFDRDQLDGRFTMLFKGNDNILKSLEYYPIGNVASLKLENVDKKCNL